MLKWVVLVHAYRAPTDADTEPDIHLGSHQSPFYGKLMGG